VIWDSDGNRGLCWNADLLLYDGADVEAWIRRLIAFLRQWGVLDRAISFSIIREGGQSKWDTRIIEVGNQ
jgi:hypothetical protein